MNSKIRFIEVFFMLLVILSFAATGMMILMGNQDYSIIALAVTSLLVLIEFYLVLTGSAGRVLDLSRTGLRENRAEDIPVMHMVRICLRVNTETRTDWEIWGDLPVKV